MTPWAGATIGQLRHICSRMPPARVWRRIRQRISWQHNMAGTSRKCTAMCWARTLEANQVASIILVQLTPGMTLKLSMANLNDAWLTWLPVEQRNEPDRI